MLGRRRGLVLWRGGEGWCCGEEEKVSVVGRRRGVV